MNIWAGSGLRMHNQTETHRCGGAFFLVREHPHRFPRGWCSAQRIYNPMIAGGNHTTIPSCRQSALRNRLVTEEECGR